MDVFVANEQELPVDETKLSDLARHTLAAEDMDDQVELSILFVGADHMKLLNKRFAGNDYATDVLAFPMMDDDEDSELLLGDVVVCPQVAQDNARKLGRGLAPELETLLVHGTLHLLGYDHQSADDKEAMDKRVTEVLASYQRELTP
ncbi:MAG: putative rRNA maturation factor [Actinomycetota bacterium]|jgi:probable rRNA maturation factor|nr:putative rRNA maturation factor [Actinomycetota bacterium]